MALPFRHTAFIIGKYNSILFALYAIISAMIRGVGDFMNCFNCWAVYFSPTYTTKNTVRQIAGVVSGSVTEFDITDNFADMDGLNFNGNDFVIIGIPVYSGRVPELAKNIIMKMKGNNTPIALVATYGNRHYDDALLELKTITQSNGFVVVAAAAFVTEHSVVQKYGKGRPNNEDVKVINTFGESVKNKLNIWDISNHTDLKIPGNLNYRKYMSIPIKPHVSSKCIKCGLCAEKCPAGAIPADSPNMTDKSKCVTCVRCVRLCPQKARSFYGFEKLMAEVSLYGKCKTEKQPEIFI